MAKTAASMKQKYYCSDCDEDYVYASTLCRHKKTQKHLHNNTKRKIRVALAVIATMAMIVILFIIILKAKPKN